jgi:hypothetical protein
MSNLVNEQGLFENKIRDNSWQDRL